VAEWGADWSYAYLERLLAKASSRRRYARLGDARAELATGDPLIFLRHDVDVSLERARAMAELEATWGVTSTYHVMLSSPFYDLASRSSQDSLRAIRAAGHEVGVHVHPGVDASAAPGGASSAPEVASSAPEVVSSAPEVASSADDAMVAAAASRFADLTGIEPCSLSFHLPASSLMNGPLVVGDRVNAYGAPLLGWYLSDSRGRWREGDPSASLDAPRSHVLQLLVHPLWWGPDNLAPGVRLHQLALSLASTTSQSYDAVADALDRHILARPSPP